MSSMRVIWAAVAAAVIASSATGCSSSSKGRGTTGTAPATNSSTSSTSASSSSAAGGLDATTAQARLLTPAEVGTGFTAGTYTPTTKPEPCDPAGTPPLDTRIPPQVAVGVEADNASPQAVFEEQITSYSDAATATRALATGEQGFGCTAGTVYYTDGTKASVTISAKQDISTEVGMPVDAAVTWSLSNSDLQGALVVVRIGQVIIALTFSSPAGADTAKLPDVQTVTKLALAKVQNG